MMDNSLPEIAVSANLPDDRGNALKLLESILNRAAEKSHVTIKINFFNNPGKVYVYDQSKTDSPETTMLEGAEVMSEKTEIHANSSVVNYKSRLDNVRIMLEASASHEESERDKDVHQAIKAFSSKLEELGEEYSDEVELLSQRLEELTGQVSKPAKQRKSGLLAVSSKGLLDAAKTVGKIVPGLIETAETIATKIAEWQSQ